MKQLKSMSHFLSYLTRLKLTVVRFDLLLKSPHHLHVAGLRQTNSSSDETISSGSNSVKESDDGSSATVMIQLIFPSFVIKAWRNSCLLSLLTSPFHFSFDFPFVLTKPQIIPRSSRMFRQIPSIFRWLIPCSKMFCKVLSCSATFRHILEPFLGGLYKRPTILSCTVALPLLSNLPLLCLSPLKADSFYG